MLHFIDPRGSQNGWVSMIAGLYKIWIGEEWLVWIVMALTSIEKILSKCFRLQIEILADHQTATSRPCLKIENATFHFLKESFDIFSDSCLFKIAPCRKRLMPWFWSDFHALKDCTAMCKTSGQTSLGFAKWQNGNDSPAHPPIFPDQPAVTYDQRSASLLPLDKICTTRWQHKLCTTRWQHKDGPKVCLLSTLCKQWWRSLASFLRAVNCHFPNSRKCMRCPDLSTFYLSVNKLCTQGLATWFPFALEASWKWHNLVLFSWWCELKTLITSRFWLCSDFKLGICRLSFGLLEFSVFCGRQGCLQFPACTNVAEHRTTSQNVAHY